MHCKTDTHKESQEKLITHKEILKPYYDNINAYPDSIKLYELLIDTLANRGFFKEAAAWSDSARQRDQHFKAAWLLIKGDLFRMGKEFDSAISAYREYLTVFPDDEQILLNLANTYAEKGDSLTLRVTKHVSTIYPGADTKASSAYINGLYYNVAGEYALARSWFDKAIAIRYNFTEAWMERGYSFYDEKLYKEAVKNFNQLTQISVSNADAWYWLAKSYEALEDKEKAIDYYNRAYSLDRNLTEARRAIERLKK